MTTAIVAATTVPKASGQMNFDEALAAGEVVGAGA